MPHAILIGSHSLDHSGAESADQWPPRLDWRRTDYLPTAATERLANAKDGRFTWWGWGLRAQPTTAGRMWRSARQQVTSHLQREVNAGPSSSPPFTQSRTPALRLVLSTFWVGLPASVSLPLLQEHPLRLVSFDNQD